MPLPILIIVTVTAITHLIFMAVESSALTYIALLKHKQFIVLQFIVVEQFPPILSSLFLVFPTLQQRCVFARGQEYPGEANYW